jgi:hypothetical protein
LRARDRVCGRARADHLAERRIRRRRIVVNRLSAPEDIAVIEEVEALDPEQNRAARRLDASLEEHPDVLRARARKRLSMSSRVGLSLLATHGRPSTSMTLFPGPSWVTSHVPTIGSNVAGGRPTCSLPRSTLMSAARTLANASTATRPITLDTVERVN